MLFDRVRVGRADQLRDFIPSRAQRGARPLRIGLDRPCEVHDCPLTLRGKPVDDLLPQLAHRDGTHVNGKKVDIASFEVSLNDVISLSERAAKLQYVADAIEDAKGRTAPRWIELDSATRTGKVKAMPSRDDVNFPIQEQLIVELYSK